MMLMNSERFVGHEADRKFIGAGPNAGIPAWRRDSSSILYALKRWKP